MIMHVLFLYRRPASPLPTNTTKLRKVGPSPLIHSTAAPKGRRLAGRAVSTQHVQYTHSPCASNDIDTCYPSMWSWQPAHVASCDMALCVYTVLQPAEHVSLNVASGHMQTPKKGIASHRPRKILSDRNSSATSSGSSGSKDDSMKSSDTSLASTGDYHDFKVSPAS